MKAPEKIYTDENGNNPMLKRHCDSDVEYIRKDAVIDLIESLGLIHRTQADVDATMKDVKEKAKAFTEAHRGESAEEILAAMRGEEPISEDLEEASKEWLRPQLDKSYANYGEDKMMELTHFDGYAMLDAIEFGAKWKEQQMMSNAIDGKVLINGMGNPILHLWDKGKHLIDKKVKVLIIEED